MKLLIILLTTWLLPCCVLSQSLSVKPDSLHILKEVLVKNNILKEIKEAPGNVTVVDVKPYYNSNITAVQLLRQTAGIKVKQDGGYGSRVDFFINGSTGKQIKFFLDGLPLDNLGETQGINNLPLEQIERIEVYKGVLPVELGVDALGGAINIVTRKEKLDFVDASYATGSFSTHRINIAAKKYWNDKFFVNLQLGGGYSKNNYKISVGLPNSNFNLDTVKVRRFHDRYQNYVTKAEFGIVNTRMADQFTVTFSKSGLDKQIQHNVIMAQPYGEPTYQEDLSNALLKYTKNDVIKGFNLSSLLSYNYLEGLFIDTSKFVYNWDGRINTNIPPRLVGAEMGAKRNLTTYTNSVIQKNILSHRFSDFSKVSFVNTLMNSRRTGDDPFASALGEIDYLAEPSSLFKNVAGLGIETAIADGKIKLSSSVKHFYANSKGYSLVGGNALQAQQSNSNFSCNAALTYSFLSSFIFKTSFERAIRLPGEDELFGNLMFILPNPSIKPEKSFNLNSNLLYGAEKFSFDISGFFKDASDLIYLEATTQGTALYKNLLAARITGLESSLDYRPLNSFTFNANATYQNILNRGLVEGRGYDPKQYFNSRLPNTPYFFANAGITLNKADLFTKGTMCKVWLNSSYTHEYFLGWEGDGDKNTKNRIPTQILNNAGASFSLNKHLTITLESFNITNNKTYDNFRVQLPGRSFSFKTRYYINRNKF